MSTKIHGGGGDTVFSLGATVLPGKRARLFDRVADAMNRFHAKPEDRGGVDGAIFVEVLLTVVACSIHVTSSVEPPALVVCGTLRPWDSLEHKRCQVLPWGFVLESSPPESRRWH